MKIKNLFRKPLPSSLFENPLEDLPRGEEGRPSRDVHQSHTYFEDPKKIAHTSFQDRSGQSFLGVVGGTTKSIQRADGSSEYITRGGFPVGILDNRHETAVAASRGFKGVSVIIPRLLTSAASVIVIDPKGENAAATARYRADVLGQEVSIVDPFQVVPAHCARYTRQFNPLDLISLDNLNAVEDAGLIADALVVSTNEKDAHWNESAKALIEALILYVAFGGFNENEISLITLYDLLAAKVDPISKLLEDMQACDVMEGRVAAGARTLAEMGENERGCVLSTARRNLKFLDYEVMASTLSQSDFSLGDLKTKPMTVYLVLPATRLASCRGLLRLFVNLTIASMERSKVTPPHSVNLILDEFASLGYMRELETAIGLVAGMGLKITTIVQDFNQLRSLYGAERWESFLANSGVIQCFSINDSFTSEWISNYLGKTTMSISNRSGMSLDQKIQGQSGVQRHTIEQALLSPTELRRYLARDDRLNRQLVLIPGKRPWLLSRAKYYDHELFAGRFD